MAVTEPEPQAMSGASPVPGASPGTSVSWLGRAAAISELRLTWLAAAVLFALYAWPLLLVPVPPLQDLPNHLATAHIVAHPQLFP